jgi:hypothetical protein
MLHLRKTLTAAVVTAVVGLSCDEMSPTPAAQVGGDWSGQYLVANCSSQGGDFRHCSNQQSSDPFSIRLHLHQSGTAVTGTAEIASAFAIATTPVSGIVDHTGRLALSGDVSLAPSGGITVTDHVRVFDWTTQIAPAGSALSGQFHEETAGYYGFSDVRFTSVLECEIVTLVKQ